MLWSVSDELVELWDVKDEVYEEFYAQVVSDGSLFKRRSPPNTP
jgi:hypothetical protein